MPSSNCKKIIIITTLFIVYLGILGGYFSILIRVKKTAPLQQKFSFQKFEQYVKMGQPCNLFDKSSNATTVQVWPGIVWNSSDYNSYPIQVHSYDPISYSLVTLNQCQNPVNTSAFNELETPTETDAFYYALVYGGLIILLLTSFCILSCIGINRLMTETERSYIVQDYS